MQNLETGYSLDGHPSGEPRNLDAPLLRLDLGREADELRKTEAFRSNGHSAKTLVKYPSLRVVLIALRAGARMGEHRAPGQILLQTLSGSVRLKLGEETIEAGMGSVIALGETWPHDLEAREDSLVLLTLAWREDT